MINLSFLYLAKTKVTFVIKIFYICEKNFLYLSEIIFIFVRTFFYNFGIRTVIIYFCFVLTDLINDYKNIYFRNNNVCVGVCGMVFIIFSVEKCYEGVFMFVGLLFLT